MVEGTLRQCFYGLFILLVLLIGCKKASKEKSQGNIPAGAVGMLLPEKPTLSSGVIAVYRAPEDAKVQWVVNGSVLDVSTDTLVSPYIEPYDTVAAYLQLAGGKRMKLGEVVIGNRPPKILSVKILPEKPRYGDDLKVTVDVEDPDNQEVTLYVKWFINDKMVYEGEVLPGSMIKAGDRVACEVLANDGYVNSVPVRINAPWVVQNTPPRVVAENAKWEGSRFIMPLKVEDPDGDKVTLKIVEGPPGIKLSNNAVIYELKRDTTFSAPVELIAEDGKGGKTNFKFTLEVRKRKIE